MENQVLKLENGLRLVYSFRPGEISHCALMVEAGSRDEPSGKAGLAHFIEHVLFKGTRNRNAYQVMNRLDVVGGELNAYTTKEETCVHASMLNEHFQRGTDLVFDIVMNATFPEKEIAKEKEVVLDEINGYKDSPAEQIYDDFECLVFNGHPLGKPILGTPESVRSFTRNDITRFTGRHYHFSKMVFSYSGQLSFTEVRDVVLQAAPLSKEKKFAERIKARNHKVATNVVASKNISHSHFITGGTAYSAFSAKRFPLFLLNNILGGPGMNSRLNLTVREKYGFTYHIESAYMPFRDTGLFHVYYACEKKLLERCMKLVETEFKKLKDSRIAGSWLSRYKSQLKGQIALARESSSGIMLNNAKSVLTYGKPVRIRDIFNKVDAINSSDIMAVANEILDHSNLSSLMYDPVHP